MIFSNITTPLLGLVDTAVIGHLEHAYYLGGIATGSMVIALIFWLAGSLRMATTGVISQAIGEDDHNKAWDYFWHSLALSLTLALLLLLFQTPIQTLAFYLIDGSDKVQQFGQEYFGIRIFSAPAALMNLVFLGYFIASQRVKWVVIQLVVINSINIALDLWFVLGLKWGVAGVASASVIADYCGLSLLVFVLRHELRAHFKQHLNWRWQMFKKLFSLNKDIFVRSAILQICIAFMTVRGARIGDVTLAANAIILNLFIFISYALDGFAYAAESLVGQAYGQQTKTANSIGKIDWMPVNRVVYISGAWCAIVGCIFGFMLFIWGQAWIGLLTDIPEVLTYAYEYLPWMSAICMVAWLSFLLDGVYIGLTRSKEMRDTMAISGGVFFALVFATYSMGNHGLWLAFFAFMLTRGVTLTFNYLRLSK